MNIQGSQIIGELVAQDYRTASIFKKYKIDFCCQGKRTIHDACKSENINSEKVLHDLNYFVQELPNTSLGYQSWPLDLLADYIEKTHHKYVETKTLEIQPYLDKIVRVHSENHSELLEIKNLFNAATGELAMHMKKEELILFPYIKKMVAAESDKTILKVPMFESVENPIQAMMNEHTTEGDRFRKIAELSSNYTPPIDACNTYKVTFALLNEFEQDLHLHIHLENNILFPKAIALEKQLL